MDDCFQVKEENIEYKEAKENFHAISAIHTEIEIKEEPLENNEFKDTKDNFLEKATNDTDIDIKEEPVETMVENDVGVSEIKPEQNEELYDPLNVTSVYEEKKLLKCDVGSKNGNRQVRCFCKVYLSCTNTITNPLDFISIYKKEKLKTLEYKLRCIICSMKFANRAQLEEHARSVHEKLKPFKCTICDTKFARKSGLIWHNRTIHEKKKPFKCTICHSEFACKEYLEKHTNSVHDEKIEPLKCMLCNFKFASKQYLERHTIAVHEKKKLFNCTLCNGNFSLKTKLEEHITTVHEKNILLRLKDALKRHIKLVHEKQTVFTAIKYNSSVNTVDKPKKLKIESRDFDLPDDCQIDVLDEAKKPKNQNGILEAQAPVIRENKAMEGQRNQQISESITFEEKKDEPIPTVMEWKCDFCSATFFNKKNMDRHITLQLHCKLCKKNFQAKQNLNVHVASVHQGVKPFECSICNSRFSQKKSLVIHIASVHKVDKTV